MVKSVLQWRRCHQTSPSNIDVFFSSHQHHIIHQYWCILRGYINFDVTSLVMFHSLPWVEKKCWDAGKSSFYALPTNRRIWKLVHITMPLFLSTNDLISHCFFDWGNRFLCIGWEKGLLTFNRQWSRLNMMNII